MTEKPVPETPAAGETQAPYPPPLVVDPYDLQPLPTELTEQEYDQRGFTRRFYQRVFTQDGGRRTRPVAYTLRDPGFRWKAAPGARELFHYETRAFAAAQQVRAAAAIQAALTTTAAGAVPEPPEAAIARAASAIAFAAETLAGHIACNSIAAEPLPPAIANNLRVTTHSVSALAAALTRIRRITKPHAPTGRGPGRPRKIHPLLQEPAPEAPAIRDQNDEIPEN